MSDTKSEHEPINGFNENKRRHGVWQYLDLHPNQSIASFDQYAKGNKAYLFRGSYNNGQKEGLWSMYEIEGNLVQMEIFII